MLFSPHSQSPELPSFEDFKDNFNFRFGKSNPEIMTNPYWVAKALDDDKMAMTIKDFYRKQGYNPNFTYTPVYTHDRYGTTEETLPNGDIIRIAGEHGDSYEEDFIIYNDIVKFGHDGKVTIYGYPEEVFPPTDNHSSVYVPSHNAIYIIGGYQKNRKAGDTLVYKLDLDTFAIECIPTTGTKPGWISRHKCMLVKEEDSMHGGMLVEGEDTLIIGGGGIFVGGGRWFPVDNEKFYKLSLSTFVWEEIDQPFN